jgi:hypothetical protein
LICHFFLAKKVLSLEKKKNECMAKNVTVVILLDNLTIVVFLCGKGRQKAKKALKTVVKLSGVHC